MARRCDRDAAQCGGDSHRGILYDHAGSHASAFASSGPSAREIVQSASARWFPYPWPNLTIVDGPEKGMEYPMFVMSEPGLYAHEILHQWWPMAIGTDERRYAFMDEGVANWAISWLTEDRTGRPPALNAEGRISPMPFILPDGENGKAMPYGDPGRMFMRFMDHALGKNLDAFWYEWLFAAPQRQ